MGFPPLYLREAPQNAADSNIISGSQIAVSEGIVGCTLIPRKMGNPYRIALYCRVLKGGVFKGRGNWGTLRIPREDWGTLGNIREY